MIDRLTPAAGVLSILIIVLTGIDRILNDRKLIVEDEEIVRFSAADETLDLARGSKPAKILR